MKTSWRIFFGVIIAILLIYILRKINLLEVYHILQGIKSKFFILAVAAYSLAILVFTLRGIISIRKILQPEFWFFIESTLAGNFVNIITPGMQIGGEPVRAYFLGKKYNKPKTKVLGALLVDRILNAAVSLFFVIASLLFILTYIPVSGELKIIFQTVLFCIILFLLLILFLNLKKTNFNIWDFVKKMRILKVVTKNKKIREMEEHFGNFTKSFKKTIANKKTFFFGIIFSFAYWILIYLSSYFLFLSLDIKIEPFLVIVVVSLGSLVGDFSPSPGGFALVEGFMIFLYSLVGVSLSAAIVVSILSRLIGYLESLVLGGFSLLHLEKTLG